MKGGPKSSLRPFLHRALHIFVADKLSGTTTHQPIRSVRMSENQICLSFPRQDLILLWLVGIHPTLANFLSALENWRSPEKKLASL